MKGRALKAAAAVVILAGALLCAGWIDVERNCTVRADNSNLAECAARFLRHGEPYPAAEDFRIYDSVSLGTKKYVLAEYVQAGEYQLCRIILDQGLNGQYKIDRIGCGGGSFREEVVAADGQKYYVLGGRNAYFGISTVKIVLDGREYLLTVPEGEHFLVYTEINAAAENTHSDLDKLRFYNGSGGDITDRVPWN